MSDEMHLDRNPVFVEMPQREKSDIGTINIYKVTGKLQDFVDAQRSKKVGENTIQT